MSENNSSGSADGEIVIPLSKPVEVAGEKLTELRMREPTGGDIERYGYPVVFDFKTDPPGILFVEAKMAAMLSGLSSHPPSTIKRLHPRDWTNAAWRLARFFTPGVQDEEEATTPS